MLLQRGLCEQILFRLQEMQVVPVKWTLADAAWNLPDAIALWQGSDAARECFGDEVHHHVLTMATAEWQAFNRSVTDWELRRYWERI